VIDRLSIGLADWIIMDGNYRNFACGDAASFALEFYAADGLEPLPPQPPPQRRLSHIAESRYEIVAEVTHLDDGWWVIDPGIGMFREDKPPPAVRLGDWVRGTVYVGIDPFFYFERLSHLAGAPPLIYDWIVEKIDKDVSPLIEIAPRTIGRDPQRIAWRAVEKTGWQGAAPSNGEYVLHCKRVGGGPSLRR